MDILKELWFGNIRPQESGIYDRSELKQTLESANRDHTNLENTLNEEQKNLLNKYLASRDEYESIAQILTFEYGVRFGAKLMLRMLGE